MKNIMILSVLIALLCSACRKNETIIEPIIPVVDPTSIEGYSPIIQSINASLIGYVVDESGEPLKNVSIQLGNNITQTDNFGHFFYDNVNMNAKGTIVKVSKNGYFTGSKRFYPHSNGQSNLTFELVTKSFDKSFDSDQGGVIEVDGATVRFEPNEIKNLDGTIYHGVVKVATKLFDPNYENVLNQLPGNSEGVGESTDNKASLIKSYGILAVELQTEYGELLNIADGKFATLSIPVTEDLLVEAPSELKLWSYNEKYGVWKEETKAVLQGSSYVGEVSHFTVWDCGEYVPTIELTLNMIENGSILNNFRYVVQRSNAPCFCYPFMYGNSDENGTITGKVPEGTDMSLRLYDKCANVILNQSLGSFSQDTDLGDVEVTLNNVQLNNTVIKGSLLCDGDPVNNGLIVATYDGRQDYYYISSSDFEFNLTPCETTTAISVVAYNLDDLTQSELYYAAPDLTNVLGDIDLCSNSLESFFTIKINGVSKTYPTASIQTYTNSTVIYHYDNSLNNSMNITFNGITTGNYSSDLANVEQIVDPEMNWIINGDFCSMAIVNEYGNVGGGIISGTFEGTFWDQNNNQEIDVQGAFRAILD